jgi:hypothetical protein
VSLPFTAEQFFALFAAYNRQLWPVALGLWVYALVGVLILARSRDNASRFVSILLAVQWLWVALAYHVAFFSTINPAAWIFAAGFLVQSALFAWFGVASDRLRFSPTGSLAWILIVYGLAYPMIVQAEGHSLPAAPTFGLPCPTTLLTVGFLLTADRPWPRTLAVIPVAWALVGGSASVLLGVRADLMLYVAGFALMGYALVPTRSRVRA